MRALASEIARKREESLSNAAGKRESTLLTGDTHKVDSPITVDDLDEGANRHRTHVVVELDAIPQC